MVKQEALKSSVTIRFWSSVEYSAIMHPITRELQNLGYNANHHFLIPEYKYRCADTYAKRIWLRIQMYVIYPIYFLLSEAKQKSGVCITSTNPFFAPLISALIVGDTRRSIHLLYDLFPDALILSQKVASHSLISKILHNIVNSAFALSSANVILGIQLKESLRFRLPRDKPNVVIPVGTDCSQFDKIRTMPHRTTETITVLYCGNLGHLHDVDTISQCLQSDRINDLAIAFRFCGNGAGMEKLKKQIGQNGFATFSSGLNIPTWIEELSKTPIGLVTMKPGAESILLPSKTYSAMAAGQAILAICPKHSDLAELILEHDCGWVVEPGDTDKLVETLKAITGDPSHIDQKRMNAQRAANCHYDAQPVAKLWATLFQRLVPTLNPVL